MKFGPLYSPKNALGILLATGNVGYNLATKAEDTNTYLSRDGGKNWNEVRFFENVDPDSSKKDLTSMRLAIMEDFCSSLKIRKKLTLFISLGTKD